MQITLIFLLIIVVLLLANVFHRRIASAGVILLNVFLVILLVAALIALFLPDAFTRLTESAFGNSILAIQLQYLDTTLSSVGNAGNSVLDGIRNLLQQQGSQAAFQSQLYPQLVSLIAGVLRLGTLVTSVILMGIITYLRFSLSGSADARHLAQQVKSLEARIASLEVKRVAT